VARSVCCTTTQYAGHLGAGDMESLDLLRLRPDPGCRPNLTNLTGSGHCHSLYGYRVWPRRAGVLVATGVCRL